MYLGSHSQRTLHQRDWKQQCSSLDSRISICQLKERRNVVYLNQKVPPIDKHRQACTDDEQAPEYSDYCALVVAPMED